jgi:hypothetical protein
LLHGGNTVGGWTAKQIHEAVLATFQLPTQSYGLNRLRRFHHQPDSVNRPDSKPQAAYHKADKNIIALLAAA